MRQQQTMHPPYCYLLRDYPIVSAMGSHRRCLTVLRPVPHSERAVIFSRTVREMNSAAMNLHTVWLDSIIIRYLILQVLSHKSGGLSIVRKSRKVGLFSRDIYLNDVVRIIPFIPQRLIRGSLPKEYFLRRHWVNNTILRKEN